MLLLPIPREHILYVNSYTARFIGCPEYEIEKQSLKKILETGDAEKLITAIPLFSQQRIVKCEIFLCYRDNFSVVNAQLLLDETNTFKNGSLLVIVFQPRRANSRLQKEEKNESLENEMLMQLKTISQSLNSIVREADGSRNMKTDIDLSEYDLTGKEETVVLLLLKRKTTKEIAQSQGLAEITIRKHLTSIYRKFGVSSREDLLLFLHDKNIACSGFSTGFHEHKFDERNSGEHYLKP